MSLEYTVGQRLGDYEILGVLGAGGMGKVYKVRNVISDRVEAMKILLPNLAGQKDLADRFLREIKLLASLNHPNIAALRTALTLDNQLVMIMEFVDGVTLSSRLQQGPIPPGQAIPYIDQVLAALSYAHQQNIIHRDIKPANMMLTAQGVVKLMDFGIARSSSERSLTVTGTTLGSLNYMPPEQVKGEPADARSDLYSLGASLYELVTGQLPFQADSNYSMMAAHLQEAPKPPVVVRPGLPEALNQIILMAMAKDPAQRFQSANAFRAALKSVPTQGVPTQPAMPSQTPTPAPSAGMGASAATSLFQGVPSSQSQTTLMDSPAYQTPRPASPSAPAAAPMVVAARGHRGLYIGLGAFIVVVVLFAAGLYLPGHIRTQAGGGKSFFSSAKPSSQNSTPATTSPAPPAASENSPAATDGSTSPASGSVTPSAPASSDAAPASSSPTEVPAPAQSPDSNAATSSAAPTTGASSAASSRDVPPPSPSVPRSSARHTAKGNASARGSQKGQSGSADSSQQSTTSGGQAAPAVDPALAEEAEHQYDQLDSRTSAVTQSLDGLKRQQAAQGYGLRGDIVSAQQRLETYMSKAHYFLQKQDPQNAKKYLDLAEPELEKIEKFLGH